MSSDLKHEHEQHGQKISDEMISNLIRNSLQEKGIDELAEQMREEQKKFFKTEDKKKAEVDRLRRMEMIQQRARNYLNKTKSPKFRKILEKKFKFPNSTEEKIERFDGPEFKKDKTVDQIMAEMKRNVNDPKRKEFIQKLKQ